MSDSIVQILTLKFLGCFLNSELNPILAAKALAMSNGFAKTPPTLVVQLVELKSRRERGVTSCLFPADGR